MSEDLEAVLRRVAAGELTPEQARYMLKRRTALLSCFLHRPMAKFDPGNPYVLADIAISHGRFAKIGKVDGHGKREIDAGGEYVSPGWIDIHVHVYGTLGFADPDSIGIYQGVTSFIDAGGPGIASEVPAKFVMDNLFERQNIGLATAAATSMLITIAAVLGPWLYWKSRRESSGATSS